MVRDDDNRNSFDQVEDDLHSLEDGVQSAYDTISDIRDTANKYNDYKNGKNKSNENNNLNGQNGSDQNSNNSTNNQNEGNTQNGGEHARGTTGNDAAANSGSTGAGGTAGSSGASGASGTAGSGTAGTAAGGATDAAGTAAGTAAAEGTATTAATTATTTASTTAATTAAGTAAGSVVPGVGNVVGAAAGLAIGAAIQFRDKIAHALIAIIFISIVLVAAIFVGVPTLISGNVFRLSGDNATYSLDSSKNLVIDKDDNEKYNKDSYEYGKMNSKGLVDGPYTDAFLDTSDNISDIMADAVDKAYGTMSNRLKDSGISFSKSQLKNAGENGGSLYYGNKESASGKHYILTVSNQANTSSMLDIAHIMSIYSVSMNNKMNSIDYKDDNSKTVEDDPENFDYDGTNIKDMQKKLKKSKNDLYNVVIDISEGETVDEEIYVDTEYQGINFNKAPISFLDYCNADGSRITGTYYDSDALVTKKTKDPEALVENVQSKEIALYKQYKYSYVVLTINKGDAGFPGAGSKWSIPSNKVFYRDQYNNSYCSSVKQITVSGNENWLYRVVDLETWHKLYPSSNVASSSFWSVNDEPERYVTVYYNAGDHTIPINKETIHWQPATAKIADLNIDTVWDAFFVDKTYRDSSNSDDIYYFYNEGSEKKYYSQNEALNEANDKLGKQEAHHGNIFGKSGYHNWFDIKNKDENGKTVTVKTVFLDNNSDALTGSMMKNVKFMNTEQTNQEVVMSTLQNIMQTITGSDDPALWQTLSQGKNNNWTVIRSINGVLWRCVPEEMNGRVSFVRKEEPITTKDPDVTFSPKAEDNLEALAKIFNQSDLTDITGATLVENEKGHLKIEKSVSGEYCEVPSGKSFKSWTNYVDSIGRSTSNWALLTGDGTYTDSDGFRRNKEGDYFVALGSYYTHHEIGARFLIETATGNKFTVQICDEKADKDTDSLNQYTVSTNDACEFYVDSTLNNKVKVSGDCSSMPYLSGAIISITRLNASGNPADTGASITKVEYWYSYDYYELSGQGSTAFVAIAEPELGKGGSKYQDYVGVSHSTAWCACFVSWCLRQACNQGLIGEDLVAYSASSTTIANFYRNKDLWHPNDGSYSPMPGDLFFLNDTDGTYSHIGIVKSNNGDTITTIEGNVKNTPAGDYTALVRSFERSISEGNIGCFCSPFAGATGKSLGFFRCTAYCPCRECSEGFGTSTSSGATCKPNHTIAADTSILKMGTEVIINGIKYKVEDTGGGVKGKHIDIYFEKHSDTVAFGNQYLEVFLAN